MKCTLCMPGAIGYPFYNINLNKTWGLLCVEGRAVNEVSAWDKNPSLGD